MSYSAIELPLRHTASTSDSSGLCGTTKSARAPPRSAAAPDAEELLGRRVDEADRAAAVDAR